jgi:PAS domain S-box-containing protein
MNKESPRRPNSERLDALIDKIGVIPPDELIRELLRRGAATLGVERAGYWSMDADGGAIRRRFQLILSNGAFEDGEITLKAADFPGYFAALREGSNLVVADDVMNDPILVEFRESYFTPLGIGAMLDAPVHRRARLYGVVCLEHVGGPREWTEAEVDHARYMAQWVALALEIEERQRTEQALRESEARYRVVMELAPVPMVVADLDSGHFVKANDCALRFFGVSREELMEAGPADFSPEFQPDGQCSREAARLKIELAVTGGQPRFEWTHRSADGREIPCLIHLADVPSTSGRRVIATITDLTEQLEHEAKIRKSLESELELNELRSRFTSIVSHEFRTPLGIIMSAVELLRNYHDRLDAARRDELCGDIHQSTRRMADLMEQVLVLGRADAGKLLFSPAPLRLEELCGRLVDESQSAMAQKCPVRVQMEIAPEDVMADESLMRHIFSNLLTNAVKYSHVDSPVDFLVQRENSDAVFTVRDRGIGIPAEDQPRLFEAFHRAGNVGEISGSGLGLLIARRCVDLHQGSIDFVSEPGVGTTFTVRLPLFVR